jgi:hypothetical protein
MRTLRICASCQCHFRSIEHACPHCGARPGASDSVARRTTLVFRRVATAALLGLTTIGCAPDKNNDVQGNCINVQTDGAPDCRTNCGCGTGGVCVSQSCGAAWKCISCECNSDEYCDEQGLCHASGPRSSSGACYGSPPLPYEALSSVISGLRSR